MPTIAYIADTHINSTLGVLKPTIHLDDGGSYHASPLQKELWAALNVYAEQINKLPRPIITIHGGDLGELDTKKRSNQIVSANKATIQEMIVDTLQPIIDVSDHMVFIRGTLAHTGKSNWLEEAIAKDIDISIPDNNTQSHYQFRSEIDGVRVDFAHHASMGSKPWTFRKAAIDVGEVVLAEYLINMGEPAPNIVGRSHNHRYADSGGNFKERHDMLVILSRCWQGKTEFVYRIGRENSVPSIGGHAFIIDHGLYEYADFPFAFREGRRNRLWKSISL